MTSRNHTYYGVHSSLESSTRTELGILMNHTSLGIFNLNLISLCFDLCFVFQFHLRYIILYSEHVCSVV